MLKLPVAIDCAKETGKDEVLLRSVELNGPRPEPEELPDCRTDPFDVAAIENVNWSAVLTLAPVICVVNLIEAKRTANMAPCNPLPTRVVVTEEGVLLPTMYAPTVPAVPVSVNVLVPTPDVVG